MNEQDYLREAAGLADGWTLVGNDLSVRRRRTGIMYDEYGYDFDSIGEFEIDALAAQLVRQYIEKTGHRVSYEGGIGRAHCWLEEFEDDEYQERGHAVGETFSDAAIKAIVDSEALK